MRRGLIILAGLLLVMLCHAQQDPHFSQHMYTIPQINPGAMGSRDMICLSGASRQQWVGFEGAPSVNWFNANASVRPFGLKSGVGLSILSDGYGFNNDLGLSAAYAYRLDIGNGTLGIGINLGLYNQSVQPEWYIPDNPGRSDVQQATQDPSIPNEESRIAFDMGLGLYYHTDDLYFGVSSTHLNQPTISFETANPYLARHYYAVAGYRLQLPNPMFELLPSAIFRTDARSNSFDISTMVRYNKKFWGGVSYRAGDALIGIIGFELFNGLRIGYAYDFGISDIGKYNQGSHEFTLGYCFSLSTDKVPQKYKSIRFL